MSISFAKLFDDLPVLITHNGEGYRYVKNAGDKVMVWRDMGKKEGDETALATWMNADNFNQKSLQDIGLWDKLGNDVHERVTILADIESGLIKERLELERESNKGRRAKHVGYPDKLKCSTCGQYTHVQASVLAGRIEKLGIDLDTYIVGYRCQKCNPTKGRKKKDWGNVPEQLVCACGHVQKYPQAVMVKMAEKKGVSMEEFCNGYRCQKCNPTKGRHKRV